MSVEPVGIGLVGVKNFAASHLRSIRQMEEEGLGTHTCAVIRRPDVYADAVADFQSRKVTIYTSLEEMLAAERGRTELVCLPTAIPDHAHTTIATLEAGYDVLLEKPPAPVIQQLDQMQETVERTGRFCAVGFQNQSKGTVRELKKAICADELGTIRKITVMAEWVRPDSYYARNPWAGKIMFEGRYCLDGATCNALAHYLFNPLYWASPTWGHAQEPAQVQAELYRAHPIESEDTSAVRVMTTNGVEIVYLVTLAGWENRGPLARIEGDRGTAHWQMHGDCTLELSDGTRRVIAEDGLREHDEVFRNAIRFLRGEESELNASLAMTRPYVLALNGAWESAGGPLTVDAAHVTREPRGESIFTGINGIPETLDRCYAAGVLYSEADVPWAQRTDWFDLTDYRAFSRDFSTQ